MRSFFYISTMHLSVKLKSFRLHLVHAHNHKYYKLYSS